MGHPRHNYLSQRQFHAFYHYNLKLVVNIASAGTANSNVALTRK